MRHEREDMMLKVQPSKVVRAVVVGAALLAVAAFLLVNLDSFRTVEGRALLKERDRSVESLENDFPFSPLEQGKADVVVACT